MMAISMGLSLHTFSYRRGGGAETGSHVPLSARLAPERAHTALIVQLAPGVFGPLSARLG